MPSASSPGPGLERLPALERRKSLLKAATHVFAERNYHGATTAQIAAAAGISEPLIYKHFASKKALFLAILEHVSRRVGERWQTLRQETADPTETLRRQALRYVANLGPHADELKIQFQALAEVADPDVRAQLVRDWQGYARSIERLLAAGQRGGLIRPDIDLTAAAWQFVGLTLMASLLSLLALPEEITAERIGTMVDYLMDGLVTNLSPPAPS